MIYWKVDLSLPYYCWYPIELMASSQPMNGFTNIITISWELLTFNLQTRFHSIEELLGINFTIHANKWKIIFCWIIYMFSIKIIKKMKITSFYFKFGMWVTKMILYAWKKKSDVATGANYGVASFKLVLIYM